MKSRFRQFILMTSAALLPFSVSWATVFNPAGDLVAQSETLVRVENPEYLQATRKVVITGFMVDFVSELKYSKAISGLEALMGADSDVSIKLTGSNPAQYQAITDALYDKSVEALTARGIEVVPMDALQALPEFKDLAGHGINPLPSEQDAKAGKGLFFSAQGLPLHLVDETQFITQFQMFGKKKEDNFLTFGTRFSGGFSAGQVQMAEEAIARKLGATVLKARLTVLGGQLTPDKSFWSSGKVSTRAAASFVDFVNRYAFITPEGKRARISLKETLVTDDDIGELVNVTSGGTKTGDVAQNTAVVALNVLAFAARMQGVGVPMGGSYASTSNYECRVQPESFEKALLDNFGGIAGMFSEKLKNPGTP